MNTLLSRCFAIAFIAAGVIGCTHGLVATTDESRSVVTLTPSAIAKFRDFLRDTPGDHIRLAIKGDGRTGFTYDLQVESPPVASDDIVDQSNGFAFVVSPRDPLYVYGATIDWETRQDGTAGFKFDNPNVTKDSGR